MVTGGNHVTYGDVDGDDHVTGKTLDTLINVLFRSDSGPIRTNGSSARLASCLAVRPDVQCVSLLIVPVVNPAVVVCFDLSSRR